MPTVVPPSAAIASSTSFALIPYRASWSRRTETRSIGSRPEVGPLSANGVLFVLLDPASFAGAEHFLTEVTTLAANVRSCPRAEGVAALGARLSRQCERRLGRGAMRGCRCRRVAR